MGKIVRLAVIVLAGAAALGLLSHPSDARMATAPGIRTAVTGKVIEKVTGEALPGVDVVAFRGSVSEVFTVWIGRPVRRVQGKTEIGSTVTDADGEYALTGLPAGATILLEYSSVGYQRNPERRMLPDLPPDDYRMEDVGLVDEDGAESESYAAAFAGRFELLANSVGAPAAWEEFLFFAPTPLATNRLLTSVESVVGVAMARELAEIGLPADLFAGDIVVESRPIT